MEEDPPIPSFDLSQFRVLDQYQVDDPQALRSPTHHPSLSEDTAILASSTEGEGHPGANPAPGDLPTTATPDSRRRDEDFRGVVDAHCHLDRLEFKLFGNIQCGRSLDILLEAAPLMPRKNRCIVRAVVANYCDPETYPNLDNIMDNRVHPSIGLHPKKCHLLADNIDTIRALLAHPKVVALGEVGLDHTVPSTTWDQQKDTLRQLVTLRPAKLPIIIHCRADAEDERRRCGAVTNCICIDTLCAAMRSVGEEPKDSRIHVHCFTGDSRVMEAWTAQFPHAYFGFTGMVQSFSRVQKEALRRTPRDRLLIETDSPYMSLHARRVTSSPKELWELATVVAKIRGQSARDIVQHTRDNCRRLYRI